MKFVHPFFLPILGILFAVSIPKKAISAERIYLLYGPLKFSLSVEALEIYATEGKITKELAFYANRFDEQTLVKLRQMLQQRYHLNQVTLHRLTRTPMMEEILKRIGQVISTHQSRNGFYAIRGALISAAANQNGWTFIDVMHHFPTQGISIKTELAMELLKTEEIPECGSPSSPPLFESTYNEKKKVSDNSITFLSRLFNYADSTRSFTTCL